MSSTSFKIYSASLFYKELSLLIRVNYSENPFCIHNVELSESCVHKKSVEKTISSKAMHILHLIEDFLNGKIDRLPIGSMNIDKLSEFQKKILFTLYEKVPRGETISYSALAKFANCPKAARAVGQALGANPFPLFFPCHRVVCSDGSTGGFSSGNKIKIKLLKNEKKTKSIEQTEKRIIRTD